jgi:hypothetical protein
MDCANERQFANAQQPRLSADFSDLNHSENPMQHPLIGRFAACEIVEIAP